MVRTKRSRDLLLLCGGVKYGAKEIYFKRIFMHEINQSPYTLKNFLPLVIILSLILTFTVILQLMYGFALSEAPYDFMGVFFIIFGGFKVVNLTGFAHAYREYDLIAKRSMLYAYLYPFFELTLGIMYITRSQLVIANWTTVMLMAVSSIGVMLALAQKKEITCACLGTVFKIPMTYVTLAEDIIMGLMAFYMLMKL
jgi:hypothetical protein